MICGTCRETVPDDSAFCDLCGNPLPVCPLCGKSGDGKRCIYDGTPLVPRARENGGGPLTVRPDIREPHAPNGAAAVHGRAGFFADEIILTGKNISAVLEIRDGDVIGRSEGRFAHIFASCAQISGRHAGFRKSAGNRWVISDFGSTNGTFLDGKQIPVMRSEEIRDGMKLTLSDLEFIISIPGERPPSPTATVRIRLERDGTR